MRPANIGQEASLNWLALGLLLAAWNCADDGVPAKRPEPLRRYPCVSVRAAHAFLVKGHKSVNEL